MTGEKQRDIKAQRGIKEIQELQEPQERNRDTDIETQRPRVTETHRNLLAEYVGRVQVSGVSGTTGGARAAGGGEPARTWWSRVPATRPELGPGRG